MSPRPVIHGRDHEHGGADPTRIVYESVGGDGAGGGIMFDTDPQAGGYLVVTTTGNVPGSLDDGMQLTTQDADMELIATGATAAEGNIFIAGNSGVAITGTGDEGVTVEASGDGDLIIKVTAGTGVLTLWVNHGNDNRLRIIGLPSSNPGGPGGNDVWRDSSGFLRIG